MKPNPAAIAWYVEEAQRLLEDQQRRAESLRTRAGQIAGFGAAVFALIGSNAAAILGATEGFSRAAAGVMLFAAAIYLAVSVAVAIWGATRPQPFGGLAADEIKVYASGHSSLSRIFGVFTFGLCGPWRRVSGVRRKMMMR
ncbi:MAG: hypothetical protein ACTHNP_09815 [Solirubrobacterales bacterium]